MRNKYILNIVAANLLWSFIPIVVTDLFIQISIITIIFIRFLTSGLILLILALFFVIINNRSTHNEKLSFKLLFQTVFRRNRRFYRMKNIYYYILLGFLGIILHIIFFFLTLKTTSITFTMSGFLLTIIFIAFYEQVVKSEKMDIFKAIYLVLLVFVLGFLIFISAQGAKLQGENLPMIGFIYLLLFSVTMSFFYISIDKDAYSKIEIYSINKNKNYKIPRFLIKMALSFLTGTLLLIPCLLLINIVPIETDITIEVRAFFMELPFIFQFFSKWEILFLIIFSTILPYVLIFIANVNWKQNSLTYSQWSSILNLIDPMGSLIFGVILVNEYFPAEFLFIVIFILIISIVLRYAHEVKNVVQACILLNIKKGEFKTLPLKILKYYGVISIDALAGTQDLLLNVKMNSIKEFYYLVNERLRKLDAIRNITVLFVNDIRVFEI